MTTPAPRKSAASKSDRKGSVSKRSSEPANPVTSPPTPRKGARRRSEVPPDVLAGLNAGRLETANLVEYLAMDQLALAHSVSKSLGRAASSELTPEMGTLERMRTIGRLVADQFDATELPGLIKHPSDTVRGWSAYALATLPDVPLKKRIEQFRPLADDSHFGVREWAWLALRPHITSDIETAIDLLAPWVADPAVSIRRFAVEITRPRGVWCAHVPELKSTPSLGLPLLAPLRAEPHKYVQDSVANWLNDASKSDPKWVRDLCRSWLRESRSAATTRICQRALRTIGP